MKKIGLGILIGVVVLGLSLGGVVAQGKPTRGNDKIQAPEIEMGIFIDYPVKDAHSRPPYDETEDDYRIRAGIRWAFPSVTYRISDNVTAPAEITAIQDAFQTWEDEPLSDMDYTDGGSIEDASAGPIQNYKNTVSWRNLGSDGPVGVTYYWYYPSLKQIVEFDIVLNSDLTWALGAFDVQNVMTHEVGHTLILFDLYAPKDGWLTMYGYTWLGDTLKQTLGTGDELGIQELYPQP